MAGEKISRIEKCKWVVDFRDLMGNSTCTSLLKAINHMFERKYVKVADACLCVSDGNTNILKNTYPKYSSKIYHICNGYDDAYQEFEPRNEGNSQISLCYTGTMHGGRRDAKPLFEVLKHRFGEECSTGSICIYYAGQDYAFMRRQAEEFDLASIVKDKGLLHRAETAQLQESCDMFIVLSWNTQEEQGILTGKFYEALARRKPIIAIVTGDKSHSEIRELIEKYNLGVCYEETDRSSTQTLTEYLGMQLERKKNGKALYYEPQEDAFVIYHYKEIVSRLDKILRDI